MRKYRICGIQLETKKSVKGNIEKLRFLLDNAVKESPDFILIPEMFEIVAKPQEVRNYVHSIPCELTDILSGYAKKYNTNIIGGSFFEKDSENIYNTSVIFDRNGKIIGKYRKMHLFDAFGFGESKAITPGKAPFITELDGVKFGVAICYDIRFPEIFRYYAVKGAQIVFVPAAFFQPNHDHWNLNVCSRALDNTIFIATANQTGRYWVGRSMVVNPWGIPIASAGIGEGHYIVDIDFSLIETVREKLPTMSGRKFDVILRSQ